MFILCATLVFTHNNWSHFKSYKVHLYRVVNIIVYYNIIFYVYDHKGYIPDKRSNLKSTRNYRQLL